MPPTIDIAITERPNAPQNAEYVLSGSLVLASDYFLRDSLTGSNFEVVSALTTVCTKLS